jgi:hypothetical protein
VFKNFCEAKTNPAFFSKKRLSAPAFAGRQVLGKKREKKREEKKYNR